MGRNREIVTYSFNDDQVRFLVYCALFIGCLLGGMSMGILMHICAG